MTFTPSPERVARLGASECAAALGVSPYLTPLRLSRRVLGLEPRFSAEETAQTIRGRRLQNACLDEYAEANGVTLRREGDPGVDLFATLGNLCCSPDALVEPEVAGDPVTIGVDAKTAATSEGFGEPGTDEIPVPYWWQCQQSMLVTGASAWDVAALIGADGFAFRFYRVLRDDALLVRLQDTLARWWQRHIVDRVPPEPMSREDVAALFPTSREPLVDLRADVKATALVEAAVAAAALYDHAGAQKEATATAVCRKIGAAEGIRTAAGSATWKADKNGRRRFRLYPITEESKA